ncbi:hypothetical protein ABKV19_004506 [Rosa sericea]
MTSSTLSAPPAPSSPPSLCFTASDGQMRAKSDVQLTSEFLCYLWEYSEHDIPNMPEKRNMIPMIRQDIVPWFCLFCERGRKLLKLWQHVTLCLLLRSLVFVQRLAEVVAVLFGFSMLYGFTEISFYFEKFMDGNMNM